MTNNSEVSIVISFVAGVLTFLSPCILPLFPSYITYITGKSFEDIKTLDPSSNIRKITALHSLFFILGFSIVFILLGVTFAYLGSFFGIRRTLLEKIGGLLIIFLGLHITGVFNLRFLNFEKKISFNRKKAGYLGSLLVGMAFAVGWTPCVGPILSSILIYASTLESLPRAITLLCFYSVGLGVPFFVASLMINQFLFIFNRFKSFMKFVPIATGVFLVIMGTLLFTGQFSRLSGIIAAYRG
ncbi:MAG: cytochrome c biogenesis protein CcdA [Candidatus Omnitrophica bacterium]|nr:cytochrome c biogenesis protein CcdA [Candidatus Omnitrophota bacterium]MBU4590220.1 cytochrome c biogenesis protein CcdA [Candidatus Omnitrophota bacterium]